jgi:hypothetical protein
VRDFIARFDETDTKSKPAKALAVPEASQAALAARKAPAAPRKARGRTTTA